MAEDGNETRVQMASFEEGVHARLDDISRQVEALRTQGQAAPPAQTAPGDTQLMARVQKSFKVSRMNAILKECNVARRPGLRMADKAALIVEEVPRGRLVEFLESAREEAPPAKKARAGPIGRHFG